MSKFESKLDFDLIVIGGGPAGLSAAATVAEQGCSVALIDEQKKPGGQIYRNMAQQEPGHIVRLGPDYAYGKWVLQRFEQSGAVFLSETRVWMINAQKEIGISHQGTGKILKVKHIIIASGAMERPVPFPGWTLPGVMNAGAAQILFKAQQVVPDNTTVLAGMGPLLLLLACQYLRAGVKIQALLDLTPQANRWRATPHLPKALFAHQYLMKGLKYEYELFKAGIKVKRNVKNIKALGDAALQQVEFQVGSKTRVLDTEHLFVHFGIIPVNQLTQVAGCRHTWHEAQQCWLPIKDEWGQTSVSGIFVAGDAATIAGALSAEYAGSLAGLQSAFFLSAIHQSQRDKLAAPIKKWLQEDARIRPFLQAYFRIPDAMQVPGTDQTVVCRCEEVTAGEVKSAIAAGHTDANQVKFATRCGMGPCQGRQCSQSVNYLLAKETGQAMPALSPFRSRPPCNRLSLSELASLHPDESE